MVSTRQQWLTTSNTCLAYMQHVRAIKHCTRTMSQALFQSLRARVQGISLNTQRSEADPIIPLYRRGNRTREIEPW